MKGKPYVSIKEGMQVVITRVVKTANTNIGENLVGRMFTIASVQMDGRTHNRYVSNVLLVDKKGSRYHAILDQLESCNPNYEPDGEFKVCIACGATFHESELRRVKGLSNLKSCPVCSTINCTES